jgi:kinesin family protein 3/17
LRKYEIELKKLKNELNQKTNQIKRNVGHVELEREKEQAEKDKTAALNALEVRNREIKFEKDQKKHLEEKI